MANVQSLFREYVRLDRKRRRDALSPREFERWQALKRQLNKSFSPATKPEHEDRRESVRVPVRLRVNFHNEGELRESLLTNLSRGGVFISTDSPSPIGSLLILRIAIEDEGTEVEVPGEVVSHNVGPGFSTHHHGMGVRFSDLSPKAHAAIDKLYEGALEKPENGSKA